MKILDDVDDEGKSLENLVSLNSDIEKLALEEQELYRQIKRKTSLEEQILESVRRKVNFRESLIYNFKTLHKGFYFFIYT
jgi:hypothetical protein